jgi:hypothetical protein
MLTGFARPWRFFDSLGADFPMKGGADLLDTFRVLTEYECGRAQMAIEWVARAQKPVVEIGGRPIEGCDLEALAVDLNRCIDESGEAVRGFIIPDRMPDFCCYGFYRYPWAIEALLFAWKGWQAASEARQSLWLQGLIFGYSPDAIHKFISSASCEQESSSHWNQCSDFFRRRRVEIYGTRELRVRRRSNRNGKSRRFD